MSSMPVSGTLILNVYTARVYRIIILFISDPLQNVCLQSRLFKMVTDKVKEPPKKQLLCRAKHLARGRMHTNSSLVTVSTGIPSILMSAIADSLKCIFRERERERWRDGGGSDCGPAETLTWINQGNINTVSGMKWWEGALLPQIFHPRDPSERQGTPLSCLPITACSNYLFS